MEEKLSTKKPAGKDRTSEPMFRYGLCPVSYTHLDVYKRQGMSLSFFLSSPAGATVVIVNLLAFLILSAIAGIREHTA